LKSSIYKASGFGRILPVLQEIVEPSLDDLSVTKRASLTGVRWTQFLKEQLMRASLANYISLHTAFVDNCLQSRAKYMYVSIDSNVANAELQGVVASMGNVHLKALTSYAAPGDVPSLQFMERTGKGKDANVHFSKALSATQGLQQILGESTDSIMLLARTRNFTSMMARSECDCVFLVSTVLALLARGKKVQIMLSSTAMLDPIWSSAIKWSKRAILGPSSSNSSAKVEEVMFNPDSIRFILPRAEVFSVSDTYQKYCVTEATQGYYLVWDCQKPVSSESEMKAKLSEASRLFTEFTSYGDFVVRTALYGALVPTSKDAHHAYQFGDGSQFQGVVSSDANLSMMAWNPQRLYYMKPLVKAAIGTWYDYVVSSCSLVLALPFRPQTYVSEICNVVCVDKTRFRVTQTYTGELEMETLSSMTLLQGGGRWNVDPEDMPPNEDEEGEANGEDGKNFEDDDYGSSDTDADDDQPVPQKYVKKAPVPEKKKPVQKEKEKVVEKLVQLEDLGTYG
jgi:hypothetical protein